MGILDRDTLHLLFPGLNKLLNFQRKFLIKVESIAELPWSEQRWGLPFTENVRRSVIRSLNGEAHFGTAIVFACVLFPAIIQRPHGEQ